MQERKWFRTGLSTDRVRELSTTRIPSTGHVREACNFHLPHTGQQHGPCPLVSVARVSSTGRVREACALISRVARGVLLNTDRVVRLACTGLGRLQRAYFQHGACELARVILDFARVQLLLHGSCNFPSSEVGNLIFSQYSGLFMI